MNWKLMITVVLASGATGGYLVNRYMPRIETVDKVHEVTHNNVITKIKEVTKDGVTTKETEVVDHSVDKKQEIATSVVVLPKHDWLVGANINVLPLSKPVYGVEVGHRVLGPIIGTVSVSSDLSAKVGLLVEF